jgi:hypothetical protein
LVASAADPVVGIRGQEEQEKRATSSLLAVMGAVPEFGPALLAGLPLSDRQASIAGLASLVDLKVGLASTYEWFRKNNLIRMTLMNKQT